MTLLRHFSFLLAFPVNKQPVHRITTTTPPHDNEGPHLNKRVSFLDCAKSAPLFACSPSVHENLAISKTPLRPAPPLQSKQSSQYTTTPSYKNALAELSRQSITAGKGFSMSLSSKQQTDSEKKLPICHGPNCGPYSVGYLSQLTGKVPYWGEKSTRKQGVDKKMMKEVLEQEEFTKVPTTKWVGKPIISPPLNSFDLQPPDEIDPSDTHTRGGCDLLTLSQKIFSRLNLLPASAYKLWSTVDSIHPLLFITAIFRAQESYRKGVDTTVVKENIRYGSPVASVVRGNIGGWVYYDEEGGKVLYISLKGTDHPSEWAYNLDCRRDEIKLPDGRIFSIHKGFLSAAHKLLPSLLTAIEGQVSRYGKDWKKELKDTKVILAGHSLGGALSLTLGPMLYYNTSLPFMEVGGNDNSAKQFSIITLATPPIHFDEGTEHPLGSSNILRIFHGGDIVPKAFTSHLHHDGTAMEVTFDHEVFDKVIKDKTPNVLKYLIAQRDGVVERGVYHCVNGMVDSIITYLLTMFYNGLTD